jgi:hypothetical protein
MASLNPAQAISVAQRVEQLCDFFGHSAVQKALEGIPVSMPPDFGSLGFDRALWVGLGIVGLWAALDAFYERAGLIATKCAVCKRKRCIRARFANYWEGDECQALAELEDLRHLYAHNYAGEADDRYFGQKHPRHVLTRDGVALTCGAQFDGHRADLDLSDLRYYSRTVQTMLGR